MKAVDDRFCSFEPQSTYETSEVDFHSSNFEPQQLLSESTHLYSGYKVSPGLEPTTQMLWLRISEHDQSTTYVIQNVPKEKRR
ncbi:hypothetical protein TNCV_4486701 [Trichonephila clavipes]|nr:hypothetical protein TNCV_4486701 [Trichonephila clavipes]